MSINIPDRTQTAGIPAQWDDTIAGADIGLITGNEPAILTQDRIVAVSQTLAALTVVGLDANGDVVKAKLNTAVDPAPDNSVKPIGILVIGVTTAGTGTKKGAPVYRAGCFNPDRLVWDATFDTDAKKFAAFEGSPTPTNITMRRIKTATV